MNKYLYAFLVVLFGCALAASAKKPEQPTSYAYTRGVEAFNDSQYQDALDWFDKELSEHPDNGYAYLHISFIRYFGDEYGRALSAINKAIKLIPKKDKKYKSGSYASRAKIYLAMEDTVSALNDYATAIKVNPEYVFRAKPVHLFR